MDNQETQITLDTRHGTKTNSKNTTQKTKKMSNTDLPKTTKYVHLYFYPYDIAIWYSIFNLRYLMTQRP